MKKGKTDKEKRQVYDLYEEFIKAFGLYKIKKNKVAFQPNDMVKCVYIKGLFKVVTVEPYYVVISPLEDKNERHYVGFEFVEKVEHNPKVMKVLFNE